MVLSASVPWYNMPPREFPARRWLRARYPFLVSPLVFAQAAASAASDGAARRDFPAKVWLTARVERQQR